MRSVSSNDSSEGLEMSGTKKGRSEDTEARTDWSREKKKVVRVKRLEEEWYALWLAELSAALDCTVPHSVFGRLGWICLENTATRFAQR